MVISSFNSSNTIGDTLRSIVTNDFPRVDYEIIVVDGGSTDNTVDVCREFSVKPLLCPRKGWASALNMGINHAKGDIICITDSDVIVPGDWLRRIWEFFQNHPGIDGVGGPMLAPMSSKNDIQRLTAEIFVEDQGFPTGLTRSEYLKMWSGGLICGPNYAYRRETLLHSGGFNESMFSYSDVDLCWRLIKKGKRLMFNPDIKVVHLGFPSTVGGVFRQQFKWGRGRGEVNKLHRSDKAMGDLKEEVYSFYKIVKMVLVLWLPTCLSKKKQLLRFVHYVSFFLGRLSGRG